jgi:hypothetical protein
MASSLPAHEVAWLNVAPRDSVVHQLLLDGPVQVLEVGVAHREPAFFSPLWGSDAHLQIDVKRAVGRVNEVGQWGGVLHVGGVRASRQTRTQAQRNRIERELVCNKRERSKKRKGFR